MTVTKLSLLDTGYFSGLTKAYLNKDQRLTPFYNHYFELENYEKAIEARKNFATNRSALFKVLDEQHASYYSTFPDLENVVASLKDNHTFTITTGHQLCLATGPLYFIYKIASAINLSKKLKLKYPQYNFVPVYWMASEDHDFEEINHIHLFNKKITWNAATSGATGRISNSGVETFMNDIKEILGDKINSTNFFDIIHDAYQKHSNLAEATKHLVLHLFGEHKLLVLDADSKLLKNEFKEIIKEDILGQVSNKAVLESINQIVSTGLVKEEKIQVKPRNINFFYLKDKFRKRITLEDHIYKVLETEITFTEAQLLQEIDEFPERFSPNVIMRPVYQEFILPNLVYIGGAGELSYWFELKKVFDRHQVFYPMLALRNSFLWIDNKQSEKLTQLGISTAEVFDSIEILTAKTLKNIGVEELLLNDEAAMTHQLFEQIKTKIAAIDATLGATAEGEKMKVLKSIEMLAQKAAKAQKNKHDISINQLKKIKDNLFPEGGLQERYENILWLNLKFGNNIIDQLIELAAVDKKEFTIIVS
jgi:bacillithiol biosynthesis cysteine-adding enzyme BshC